MPFNYLKDPFFNFDDVCHFTEPAMNVIEYEKNYTVEVAAPGMTKENFQIMIDNEDNLVINMEKKHNTDSEKAGRFLRRGFSYGTFKQTITLPEDADRDKITAKVENGMLEINMPKIAEEEKAAKTINVQIQ